MGGRCQANGAARVVGCGEHDCIPSRRPGGFASDTVSFAEEVFDAAHSVSQAEPARTLRPLPVGNPAKFTHFRTVGRETPFGKRRGGAAKYLTKLLLSRDNEHIVPPEQRL